MLSGGGARGFAHVGVLKALEEARVPVDFIVGTSMGAIIGGLYASGMNADELERELVAVDWGDLFDRREPRQLLSQRRKEEDFEFAPMLQMGFRDGEFRLPSGAVSSRSLEMLLRRYTLTTRHLATFNGLPTPFRAVATDMETGKAVVMEHGDLAAALRASMSVPGVFSPLEVDGQILGDGGLVNNLPVDVARRMGADIVIAVNIGTPLAGRETLGTVLGVTAQMVNILTEQNVQASLAQLTPKDLLLTPNLGKHTSADFDQALELVKIGHAYAHAERAALRRYAAPEQAYATWQTQRIAQTLANSARVGSLKAVQFEGVSAERAERLREVLDMPLDQPVSVKQIENDMQELAAMGDYERVDYRLENQGQPGQEALVVSLRENDWGPNYLRIGMDLQTDFEGRSAFNLRLSHNRHWLDESGAEWRNRIQVGETMGLYSEIYQPWGSRGPGLCRRLPGRRLEAPGAVQPRWRPGRHRPAPDGAGGRRPGLATGPPGPVWRPAPGHLCQRAPRRARAGVGRPGRRGRDRGLGKLARSRACARWSPPTSWTTPTSRPAATAPAPSWPSAVCTTTAKATSSPASTPPPPA